jgi:hypothetical protein
MNIHTITANQGRTIDVRTLQWVVQDFYIEHEFKTYSENLLLQMQQIKSLFKSSTDG